MSETKCLDCGHTKSQHIYEEGACRPGFPCPCERFAHAGHSIFGGPPATPTPPAPGAPVAEAVRELEEALRGFAEAVHHHSLTELDFAMEEDVTQEQMEWATKQVADRASVIERTLPIVTQAALASSPSPAPPAVAWQLAATAPKDGSHIVATNLGGGGFGHCAGQRQDWCAVVHYWSHPGEEGFYLSSGNDDNAVQFTHWMPLPSPSLSCAHAEGPCECGPEGFGLRDDDPRVNRAPSPVAGTPERMDALTYLRECVDAIVEGRNGDGQFSQKAYELIEELAALRAAPSATPVAWVAQTESGNLIPEYCRTDKRHADQMLAYLNKHGLSAPYTLVALVPASPLPAPETGRTDAFEVRYRILGDEWTRWQRVADNRVQAGGACEIEFRRADA